MPVPESKGSPREGSSLLGGLIFWRPLRSPHVHPLHRSIRQFALRHLSECSNRAAGYHNVKASLANLSMIWWRPKFSRRSGTGFASGIKPSARWRTSKRTRTPGPQLETACGLCARYDAERAERQHRVVEPENRLVARELEPPLGNRTQGSPRRGTREVCTSAKRIRRTLSTEEREAIRSLSKNLPALWHASTTSVYRIGSRIVRLLLERAVVNVRRGIRVRPCYVAVRAGGFTTHSTNSSDLFLRYDQIADYARMVDRISEFARSRMVVRQNRRAGFNPGGISTGQTSRVPQRNAQPTGAESFWSSSVPANA